MNPEIKKIRLKELKVFVTSELFQKFNTIPVSPLRADSYLQNPNAKPDDIVLYLAFVNNELVAFRSIFAGVAQTAPKIMRFGWCSGNWVHPGFRRRGFSEMLLREAYSDWDKKLMFTNYAPESEKLYLKTGWFKPVYAFKGARAYLFPKTKKLVKTRKRNILFNALIFITDIGMGVLSMIRIGFFRDRRHSGIVFNEIDFPDEQCFKVFEKNKTKHFFSRGEDEFRWILEHPWLSTQKADFCENYPFSSYAESFYYKFVKIFVEDEFVGLLVFSVRNGHLKTLFFWIDGEPEEEITRYLKSFCAKNRIEILTVYNNKIARHLIANRFPFLYVKKYGQQIYSTFEAGDGNMTVFQDGDGDVVFT